MISIIIPVFNRVNYICETLDSIIAQSYKDWECIVVDDGSSDYIEELLEFYCEREARIKFYKRPSYLPKGANSCRNYGFELSMGKYINWFDSDDVMRPNFLKEKIKNFSIDLNLVISTGYITDEFLIIKSELKLRSKTNIFKNFVTWNNQIITNSVIFKRTFLEKKELFNPGIHKGQEAEFFSRIFYELSDNSYQVINEPLFYYRLHKGSSTIKNKTYTKEYKSSEAYIGVKNLKRSIDLKDLELINYIYLKLLFLYFSALDHKDTKNAWFILKNLIFYLRKVDFNLSFLLSQLVLFPGITGRRSYNLERKLRLYKID